MAKLLNKIKHIVVKRHVYGWSSSLRVLPNLVVIGVVRSGTTSLYHYLSQHPSIVKSTYDELGYFDSNYKLGLNWYKSFFPSIFEKKKVIQKNKKFMTYDVTPFYIYHEKADSCFCFFSRYFDGIDDGCWYVGYIWHQSFWVANSSGV